MGIHNFRRCQSDYDGDVLKTPSPAINGLPVSWRCTFWPFSSFPETHLRWLQRGILEMPHQYIPECEIQVVGWRMLRVTLAKAYCHCGVVILLLMACIYTAAHLAYRCNLACVWLVMWPAVDVLNLHTFIRYAGWEGSLTGNPRAESRFEDILAEAGGPPLVRDREGCLTSRPWTGIQEEVPSNSDLVWQAMPLSWLQWCWQRNGNEPGV